MLSEREVSAAVGEHGLRHRRRARSARSRRFFVDDRTGAPTWVAVTTGLFGTRHSIVPAAEATFADGGLRLPVTADAVKSAPPMAGDHLDPAEEEALRRHYGLAGSRRRPPASAGGEPRQPVDGAAGSAPSPARTPSADPVAGPAARGPDRGRTPTRASRRRR